MRPSQNSRVGNSLYTNSLVASLALLLLASPARSVLAVDWPEFRGPWGDGHASAPNAAQPSDLPLLWSETNNVRWTTAIPLRGLSTPVVLDGQVWLTTATPDGHDFFVLCLDAQTGTIKLNKQLFHCDKPEPLGNDVNTYATPSAAVEKDRVYVHFGSYGTACLDTHTYQVIWQRQDLPCRHYRGPSSSVVLFENLVILTMDGADLQYLAALSKTTGELVWKTNRSVAWNDENVPGQMAREGDLRKAHSTPLIVQADGKFQLLSAGAKAAYGYDPRTGSELWRVHHEAWSASSRPVYRQGLAYIVTGFGGKTELWAVRVNGHGDVTDTHVAWKYDSMVAKTTSPILVEDQLYMVSDDGMLSCLDAATGKQIWRSRIPGNYSASPIYADGHLFFCNQQGKTTVLKPGPAFSPVATNVLSEGLWASPAVSGSSFFLRAKSHLYRVAESSAQQ